MALTLALCLLATAAAPGAPRPAWADDAPRRVVPDLARLSLEEARARLGRAGLATGEVYEVSVGCIEAVWNVRLETGRVFRQRPSAGVAWPADRPVDLLLSARRGGRLPEGMPEATDLARCHAEERLRDLAAAGQAAEAALAGDGDLAPRPEAGDPAVPAPEDEPAGAAPSEDPPASPPSAGETAEPAPEVLAGSPDAPRPAPPPDPHRVPDLVGLALADAEQLVRGADMALHVERVAGHPVGRVLEQVPGGGSARPAAGLVKVVVTAGGDFEAERPEAPGVYLTEVEVPDLLDRTRAQAERVLDALGLHAQAEAGRHGPAGRVVDQQPMAGGRVPKGGVVRVWIAPGGEPPEQAPPPGPIGSGSNGAAGGGAPPPAGGAGDAGPGATPPPPGPLPGGVPEPVAPGADTPLPAGETVPVGFTWRGVQGAEAYLVEVEEQGAEGRWIPTMRKPARRTAAVVEIERLDPDGKARLRWRVRAVRGGREGTPSRWVLLEQAARP